MSEQQLEQSYGPVVRLLGAGESFGELALLQRGMPQIASVAATPAAGVPAAGDGVTLIRISRRCYDQTVRSMQVGGVCVSWHAICIDVLAVGCQLPVVPLLGGPPAACKWLGARCLAAHSTQYLL